MYTLIGVTIAVVNINRGPTYWWRQYVKRCVCGSFNTTTLWKKLYFYPHALV